MLRVDLQVNAALQQLQIRGSSLGSNILKIEVEDYPTAFAYNVRFDELWNPKSLFRTEVGMSLEQAQQACKCDPHRTTFTPSCVSHYVFQQKRDCVGPALLRLPVSAHELVQPGGCTGQHRALRRQPLHQPAGRAPQRLLLLSDRRCHKNEYLHVRNLRKHATSWHTM